MLLTIEDILKYSGAGDITYNILEILPKHEIHKIDLEVEELLVRMSINKLKPYQPTPIFIENVLIESDKECITDMAKANIKNPYKPEYRSLWQSLYNRATTRLQKEKLEVDKAKQVPINQVVSSLTGQDPLKHRGFICCPMHGEDTPSLKVYENTNSWHCFGCKKGGDQISFVQDVTGMNFVDSTKELLKMY